MYNYRGIIMHVVEPQAMSMPPFDPRHPYNALPELPPARELETLGVMRALNLASRALANLNGTALSVPNPQLLIDTFAITEAVASSEIENVNTTSDELFRFMAVGNERVSDATKEAARYRPALSMGIERLRGLPELKIGLFAEICSQILGYEVDLRDTMVIIGNPRTRYVAYTPPYGAPLLRRLLKNLLEFANETETGLDPIIKMAIIHYQFEAIHPFPDGNGRTGRIINILYLMMTRLLDQPVLYLSRYFLRHRREYYAGLRAVTETGDWEGWIRYVLAGIYEIAEEGRNDLIRIRELRKEFADRARADAPTASSEQLMDLLFIRPYTTTRMVQEVEGVTRATARSRLDALERAGMLERIKSGRYQLFRNRQLIDILMGPYDDMEHIVHFAGD